MLTCDPLTFSMARQKPPRRGDSRTSPPACYQPSRWDSYGIACGQSCGSGCGWGVACEHHDLHTGSTRVSRPPSLSLDLIVAGRPVRLTWRYIQVITIGTYC